MGIDEKYPDVYYYRAMTKISLKDRLMIQDASKDFQMIDDPLKDFFKAIELGSKHVAIYNGISCAYLQVKKYEKALIYSNICLANHPRME